jgi:hypothetical protein
VELPATISIVAGKNLTETCYAVGVPTPEIVWKHQGNISTTATSLSLKLHIASVESQHAGRYTCTATNQFGFEQQHFDLKILPSKDQLNKG